MGVMAGCDGPSQSAAGQETGPCLEGQCFEELMCLSELCVGPDADSGETDGMPAASGDAGPGPDDDDGPGDDGDPPSGDTGGGSSEPDDDGGGADDGSDGPGEDDGGGTQSWGSCEQLDFLFVVDNSASMADEQGELIDALPPFFDQVIDRSGSDDHHVMVVDTDAWVFGGCTGTCDLLGTCVGWEDFVCGETQPLQCEDVLGAGVTHPRGEDAANVDCGFVGGERFATLSSGGALDMLGCAASVGTGSSQQEVPMEAMVTAVNPVAGGEAAACNAGFLRDAAPLVVVFVTDEDDGQEDSPGNPEGWQLGLAAAKGGSAQRIAVLGLFGDSDQPGAICQYDEGSKTGAEPSVRLHQFVELFDERGIHGSICAPSYDASFDELVGVLDSMCE